MLLFILWIVHEHMHILERLTSQWGRQRSQDLFWDLGLQISNESKKWCWVTVAWPVVRGKVTATWLCVLYIRAQMDYPYIDSLENSKSLENSLFFSVYHHLWNPCHPWGLQAHRGWTWASNSPSSLLLHARWQWCTTSTPFYGVLGTELKALCMLFKPVPPSFFVSAFWDSLSLCSPSCPGSHSVD